MNYKNPEMFFDIYEIAEKLSDAIKKYGKRKVLMVIERVLLDDNIKIVSLLLKTIQEYFKISDKKLILSPSNDSEILFTARNIFVVMLHRHFKLPQSEIAVIIKRKLQTVNKIINSISQKDRLNPYLYKNFFSHYDEILRLTLKKIGNNGTNEKQN